MYNNRIKMEMEMRIKLGRKSIQEIWSRIEIEAWVSIKLRILLK